MRRLDSILCILVATVGVLLVIYIAISAKVHRAAVHQRRAIAAHHPALGSRYAIAKTRGESPDRRPAAEENVPDSPGRNSAASGSGRSGSAPAQSASEEESLADAVFTNLTVLRIQIEIPHSGISTLRATGWGNGQGRPEAKATIREGGIVYTNVAIHLKGAAGSFRPVDDNPCFTLNFQKHAPGQSFHRLHKISLNNSVQDPSYLSEKICRELFEAAGVPVPRAAHAKVELNGRDLGLRVLTEGFNKQFLKRYFKNTKGNLYDGGFVKDITMPLAVNSGDDPQNHSGLRALRNAAIQPDPARRLGELEQTLDMERFLSFMAMDVMQCDWDGYAMNHNNWRVFHDLDANKMVFFPHGLDQMFGVERTSPDCPILPPMQGLVARAVVSTGEGRRRYFERMSELYTKVFHVQSILKRVDELAAAIRPVIAESSQEAARDHDQQVDWLKRRILERDRSLKRQLAAIDKIAGGEYEFDFAPAPRHLMRRR